MIPIAELLFHKYWLEFGYFGFIRKATAATSVLMQNSDAAAAALAAAGGVAGAAGNAIGFDPNIRLTMPPPVAISLAKKSRCGSSRVDRRELSTQRVRRF